MGAEQYLLFHSIRRRLASCDWLKLLSVVAAVFLGVVVPAHGEDPPNIVMIISDDQMWTDYGFMGHPQISTPHLDRLAEQSLLFTRGYVPDSLCRPSLATIITGLFPHQHGIVGNDPPLPQSLRSQPVRKARGSAQYRKIREEYIGHIDRVQSLPKLLAGKGYLSHQSGKWWEGHYSRGGFTHGMTHGDRLRGGRHGDLGLKIGREGLEPIFNFVDHSVAEKRPFFIWYAPFLPHTPHNPPKRLLDKYAQSESSLFVARYYAMCEWFDETCGELLGFLDRKGLAKNTIVIYVTDNGWIQDPESGRYAAKSKRSQYDGGTRTPIMIRWPGKIIARRDEQTLASSVDLAPTILEAAGITPPSTMPGINLLNPQLASARRQIFGEIFEHDIQHMSDPAPSLKYRWIIRQQWKLIVPHAPRVPGGRPELYDLANDPHEIHNLAGAKPRMVAELNLELDRWWSP